MADKDEAAEVRQIWSALGLPGVIDVHTHFMPKSVMDKVRQALRVHPPQSDRVETH